MLPEYFIEDITEYFLFIAKSVQKFVFLLTYWPNADFTNNYVHTDMLLRS